MFIEIVTSALAVLHGLAAIAVTLHVLLSHRDVRSSIGWIGLSWLSPFLGSAIYFAFGINRVQRRASHINLAPKDRSAAERRAGAAVIARTEPEAIATIARAGDAIAGLPLTAGNDLGLLEDGDEAYPVMLAAIAEAKTSIALSSYIFNDDSAGARFVNALIAAHGRGVAVRVLIDGIGSGYFRAQVFERLRAAGVPVARFLHDWAPWQMSFINLRNHKKVLVVDGTHGFTGGMNISALNIGGRGSIAVRDIHTRLSGPIVGHLMLTFARDWEFTTGESLGGPAWWPDLAAEGAGIPMRGVTSGPDESIGRIEAILATAIEQAQQRVRILTPYFLPEDTLMGVLRRAALRGVKVEIVMPEYSNHFYFNWAMRDHLQTMRLDVIDCFLTPAPFDHSKLMSVDGRWSAFGSPNWDARSMRLNFEFLVECYGQKAAAMIDRMIDAKLEGAKKLTHAMLAERPLPVKIRDASARLLLPYL